VRLSPAAATALTGTTTADAVELARALARRLERPLALDVDERAAYLGVSAAERARQLASLEAPDFALPDLEAGSTLAEHRRRRSCSSRTPRGEAAWTCGLAGRSRGAAGARLRGDHGRPRPERRDARPWIGRRDRPIPR
jgi:hypothetical protein